MFGFIVFLFITMMVIVIITSTTFQIGGTLISRVNTNEKVVALTFDDGPQPVHTDEIIRTLQKAQVPATFFLIGIEMERHPAETNKLIAAGFEIGNHSFAHDSLVFKSIQTIAKDIESTDSIIRQHGYTGIIQFRPPYGHKFIGLPYYLGSHDRATIMWDVAPDTNSALQPSRDIVKNVLSTVQPGSIIVMHAMYDHNAPARESLSQIIIELRNRGYRFVTIDNLLQFH